MTRVPRTLPIALAATLALVLAPCPARAEEKEEEEIYPCKDASGNVVYQHDPCAEPRRGKRSAGPAPAAPKPPKASAKKGTPPAPRPRYPSATVVPESEPLLPARSFEAEGSGDPRYSSPDRTWKTFVGALRSGDRGAAVDCLSEGALTSLGESFSLETLRGLVDGFTRIEVEGQAGPLWSIRALRPKQRPKWIFFERTAGGSWKIAAI